jgi:hypothetical protein
MLVFLFTLIVSFPIDKEVLNMWKKDHDLCMRRKGKRFDSAWLIAALFIVFCFPLPIAYGAGGFTLSTTSLALFVGDTYSLEITDFTLEDSAPTFQWSIENSSVADLIDLPDRVAHLVAKSVGSATVTVTEVHSGQSVHCSVNVAQKYE